MLVSMKIGDGSKESVHKVSDKIILGNIHHYIVSGKIRRGLCTLCACS